MPNTDIQIKGVHMIIHSRYLVVPRFVVFSNNLTIRFDVSFDPKPFCGAGWTNRPNPKDSLILLIHPLHAVKGFETGLVMLHAVLYRHGYRLACRSFCCSSQQTIRPTLSLAQNAALPVNS